MTLGIGTYATFWEWSSRNPNPISLAGMIERTHDLGCEVFQICDYPQIEKMDTVQLEEVKAQADELGIELELGTRGTDVNHLTKYLDIADILGTRTLRSMVQVGDGKPSLEQSLQNVKNLLPRLHEQEVKLAFETYEQLPTAKLVDFIKQIADPAVGIALDPANCVAGLEHPNDVIRRCAPYTINLHVKDFAFSRRTGWVGFTYAGAKMGEGLLDFAYEIEQVRPVERNINMIVEHWLVWQETAEKTIELEQKWTRDTIEYVRAHLKN
uniref:sugar phosphate isomerase/epimerase family protein n=1 Tax=Vaginimicrobium propionicum TaxID=1871034 RepID=UPI00097108B8|nr:TIM barrel protein [Vaginimicrobium propionicum]